MQGSAVEPYFKVGWPKPGMLCELAASAVLGGSAPPPGYVPNFQLWADVCRCTHINSRTLDHKFKSQKTYKSLRLNGAMCELCAA